MFCFIENEVAETTCHDLEQRLGPQLRIPPFSEMTETDGVPRISRPKMSRVWHVVHEPQSASASMATSHVSATSSRNSAGAGFVNVGLAMRSTVADG